MEPAISYGDPEEAKVLNHEKYDGNDVISPFAVRYSKRHFSIIFPA
jgi:hypothetical protein